MWVLSIDATQTQHALQEQRANRARLSTRLMIEEAFRRELGWPLDQPDMNVHDQNVLTLTGARECNLPDVSFPEFNQAI